MEGMLALYNTQDRTIDIIHGSQQQQQLHTKYFLRYRSQNYIALLTDQQISNHVKFFEKL